MPSFSYDLQVYWNNNFSNNADSWVRLLGLLLKWQQRINMVSHFKLVKYSFLNFLNSKKKWLNLAKTVLAISSLALIFSLIALMFYLQPTTDYSMVLHLKFDEGNGNIAYDSSKFKNNGTIYGASWIDGKFGNAISFDGINDQIKIPNFNLFSTTNFISMWIKPIVELNGRIFYVTDGIREYQCTWLKTASGSKLRVIYWSATTGDIILDSATNSVLVNIWTHIIIVFKANVGLSCYINIGVPTYTTNIGVTIMGKGDIYLGSKISSDWYGGIIDEFHIYNRILSLSEMQDIYEGRI